MRNVGNAIKHTIRALLMLFARYKCTESNQIRFSWGFQQKHKQTYTYLN